jgi:hypothetical protein
MIESAALLDQFVSEDLLVFAAGPDWEYVNSPAGHDELSPPEAV